MRQCILAAIVISVMAAPVFAGEIPNGAAENQRDDLGYYYAITGGKFPTGNIPNGDNGSGGTFRFLYDDPAWGYSYPLGVWQNDDWFPENASIAVTLQNGGATVYDNNGLEDGTYGSYYDAGGLANTGTKPGMYRGYSMSNNYDWIYAGYLKLEQRTTIDTLIAYFDPNSGFDPDSPEIMYDMNIWSSMVPDPNKSNQFVPVVNSFTGDVFSARSAAGAFSWSDTGVDRIFGIDYGGITDDIWRLTYKLDAPMTLNAGVYFFSSDAEIRASSAPLPSAAWAGFALLLTLAVRGKLRHRD